MASTATRQRINISHIPSLRRCSSQKVGFATREEALHNAELMMELGKVNPGCHIMPYACTDCHEYHLANRVIVPIGRRHKGGSSL